MMLRFIERDGHKILQQAVATRGRLTIWKDITFVTIENDNYNVTLKDNTPLVELTEKLEPLDD